MKLIRSGEIDEAIGKLGDWYPQIIQVDSRILYIWFPIVWEDTLIQLFMRDGKSAFSSKFFYFCLVHIDWDIGTYITC